MTADLALQLLSLCVLLAATETLHGLFRAAVLVPSIGNHDLAVDWTHK